MNNLSCPDTVLVNHTDSTILASEIAQRYDIPIKTQGDAATRFILHLSIEGISLQHNIRPRPSPVRVDFTSGKAAYRRGQKELLGRAIGLNKLQNPRLVDATAGLGRDAFVLASLGCEVTLIERHPLIYLLLADGILRAQHSPETSEPAGRMSLIHANAPNWLAQNPPTDVIYLDPMYPPRRKSALVKKEMQLFQALLDEHRADEYLLPSALQKARHRVVVKRPLKGNQLAGRKPDFAVIGRSTRFDVYITG